MSDAELREIVAQLAKSQEAAFKKMAESEAKTDMVIVKMAERVDKMAESKAKVDEAIEKMTAKVDATGEMIGYMSNRIGIIIELVVTPGICNEINKHGHNFTYVAPNMNIRRKDKDKLHTQVDVMLYNTTEAMAVEIKTHLRKDDVIWHLNNRLTKIRHMETVFNIKDKALYGSVAGLSVDDDARSFARENGLYVIEIQENEKTPLKIDAPVNNKPKTW